MLSGVPSSTGSKYCYECLRVNMTQALIIFKTDKLSAARKHLLWMNGNRVGPANKKGPYVNVITALGFLLPPSSI